MIVATDAGRPGGQPAKGRGVGVLAHSSPAFLGAKARSASVSVGVGELFCPIGTGIAGRPPDDRFSDCLPASSATFIVGGDDGGGDDGDEWEGSESCNGSK